MGTSKMRTYYVSELEIDEIIYQGDRAGMEEFLELNELTPGENCSIQCFETSEVPFDLEVVLEEDTDEQMTPEEADALIKELNAGREEELTANQCEEVIRRVNEEDSVALDEHGEVITEPNEENENV